MILQNKRLLYHTPGYFFGGSAIADSNSFVKNYRGRFIGETYDKKASMPLGTEGQFAYVLAQKGGGLASYTDITGSASISASQSNGINIESTMEGTSTFEANANLITSMLANLAGSGTLSASMVGTVGLASDLVGSGNVVAGLKMFAGMVADLNGNGAIEGTMKGWANMSADIYVNQSEASVQQLVSGVWNAIATEYNTSGTMGEAVQTGGGGGGATAAQIWAYSDRTLTESAGLSTEEHNKLFSLENSTGGGGGFSSQAIQTSISNAKREIIEKMEEIPTKIPQVSLENIETQLSDIDSHISFAKEEVIDTIKEVETEICSDIVRSKKELKEDNVNTRQLVRQKTDKVVKYAEKQLDRQEKIEKMIDDESEEIESLIEQNIDSEADEIEKDINKQIDKEIEEIESNHNANGNNNGTEG